MKKLVIFTLIAGILETMADPGYQTLPGGSKIPAFGLGTWLGIGPVAEEKTQEFENALDKALEIGYRHIDSAVVYKSEAPIGRVLKKWLSSGKLKREDIFITSKIFPMENTEDKVEATVKKSLEDLQINYVDLYLIHFPVKDDAENIRIYKKLEEQVDAGRIKHIGLSNFGPSQIDNILKNARIKPASLQIPVHLYAQHKDVVEYAKKNGLVVVGYSPLGSGNKRNLLQNEVLKTIAAKYKRSPAQIALRYVIQMGVIPIPKSSNPDRIRDNFNVYDFTLANEDVKTLEGLDTGEPLVTGLPKMRPPPKQ